jgi:bilin biosynthesis protein
MRSPPWAIRKGLKSSPRVAEDESVDSYVRESATSALSRLDLVLNFNR